MKKTNIYLLLGSDIVQKKEVINEILNVHRIDNTPDSLQKCVFYASEASPDEILSECSTYSFFGDKKVVLVYEADKLPNNLLKRYIDDYVESTILILLSEKVKGKFSVAIERKIEKDGVLMMFWPMFENKLEVWIERKAANEYKINFPEGFGHFLIEQCGRNSLLIESNLQILANFFASNRFTLDEASEVIHEQKEVNVFSFISKLFLGDLKQSLLIYRQLIFEGESGILLLNMIQRQIELLWRYKTNSKAVRLGKLALRELSIQSSKLNFINLAAISSIIFNIEKSIKSDNKIVHNIVFERSIIEICRYFLN